MLQIFLLEVPLSERALVVVVVVVLQACDTHDCNVAML